MGINIEGLKTQEKQIRELINTPQGTIEVYEPNIDDIEKIIEIYRGNGFNVEDDVATFDGVQVIKEFFPLLTNIEFGDITDEKVQDIVENPSVHFLIAQQVVAQIVAESIKLYSQRVKTELMKADSMMAQMELIEAIPSLIVEQAKKDGKVSDLLDNVLKVEEELKDAIDREKGKETIISKNSEETIKTNKEGHHEVKGINEGSDQKQDQTLEQG
ncbi:hypothetical protein P8891_05965 [Bacillus atrophaeus]|uniref:hypothetical protein n=1 Tax=Bacillus atrophaeus TaxID=1452 RepID=UPI0022823081|nr:hypothetical protein [Bacillus atrophaeus]MCY7947014.1 hypothetical protein [Bacillus atrophaeus]MCY8097996.1 hypothetical protein [Bacillus atrophaeus]MCY9170074.1 hypothetical protein [Bacillus atrophaeus]MEC0740628.1 hypothetical protein [Bacillus atrophaeus]MEC0746936.1 hypothetical protein [Bacillus atrophaeus]